MFTLLQDILGGFYEVGDRLSAIDKNMGDEYDHWQMINVIHHRVRRKIDTLPVSILQRSPALATFALTNSQIHSCWSNCASEIESCLDDMNTNGRI